MPSRAVTSFLPQLICLSMIVAIKCVNALSGCYLISTIDKINELICRQSVSMPSRAVTSFLLEIKKSNFINASGSVNALSGCYLISTR